MTYFYPEIDGKIFLVERDGKLTFSESRQALPFSITPVHQFDVEGHEVLYCIPQLESHPEEWLDKETVPLLSGVDKIVRKAVSYTFPRVVTEAVIQEKGQILLVKPSRGYSSGSWTLPGGFILYGESPSEGARREAEEEIGVEIDIDQLLYLDSHLGQGNSYHWIICYYRASIKDRERGNIRPCHEIEQIEWFPVDEVTGQLWSPLMVEGFQKLVAESRLT